MNEILHFTSENIFLIGSILVFTAILVSKTGNKYGVPSLLIFLLVGMLFGSDGLGLVFDNYNIAQFLSIIALCVILFTGGLETKLKDIRPVMGPGLVLSTVGVLLTVVFTGAFIYFLSRIEQIGLSLSIVMCFLLAAVMSSTDSASVFSILKNCNMRLKQNLRPMLELESGSNDPMAYVLTIVLIQVAQLLFDPVSSIEGINYTQLVVGSLVTLVLQMSLGALAGVAIGFATVWILQRIKLNSTPLYSILLLAVSMFAFSMTQMIQGNGYLAVYIAGFIIGNKPMNNRKEILSFMDGMTWIMQIGMFLSLGLLVNPHEMLHVAPIALLIGLFLLFVGRPLTVFICLLPFRKISFRAKLFTSWVGLKGAVPIIFATYPIVAGIPGSEQIFNIVFFITLLSLIFQGMSIPRVAKLLHLNLPEEKAPDTFDTRKVHSGEEALTSGVNGYDLILLDIMMEGISGLKMAEMMKKNPDTAKIPIIFISAKDTEDDTVNGLNIGADDYIAKPFSIREVLSRVAAVLRRTSSTADAKHNTLSYKSLVMDLDRKSVSVDGEGIDLTKTEFEILHLLLANSPHVYSREEILSKIWSDDVIVLGRTVDVNITRLRRKIGEYGKCVVTRHGYGYCFEEK